MSSLCLSSKNSRSDRGLGRLMGGTGMEGRGGGRKPGTPGRLTGSIDAEIMV